MLGDLLLSVFALELQHCSRVYHDLPI